MTGPAPAKARKRTSTDSIHFRMPIPLRRRLRRFAEDRNLGESEALRLVVSERLDQLDLEASDTAAERWQFEQTLKTWKEDERAGGRDRVNWEDIERVFLEALATHKGKRRRSR